MKICLVTAFEPFGNQTINASKETLLSLPDRINDFLIIKKWLPVVFHEAFEVVKPLITAHRPDCIIMLGEAGGRSQVEIERVAINMDDAHIKDNKQNQPIDEKIITNGPDGYFTKLPYKDIIQHLSDIGLKIGLSNSAGTYVCNHLMYQVLHMLCTEDGLDHVIAGFIHVPYIKEQAKSIQIPCMDAHDISKIIFHVIDSIK